MSPIGLSGLASGLDTESIITSLMSIERAPRDQMTLKDAQAQARQTGLQTLATKLGAVRDAANALKSTSMWANVQTVSSSDTARITATNLAGAAPGSHSIEISALATTSQHAFTYTAGGSAQTLSIGSWSLNVDAGTDVATLASSINTDDSSPVKAVVASGKLVLTSRTSGAAGDFSVGASPLLAEDGTYARVGADAAYTVDGVAHTSASNVVSNAVLGVDLTFKATTTSPVAITVGDPGPNQSSIKGQVQSFVNAYNDAVDFMRTSVAEQKVKGATTTADAVKGVFNGDDLMNSMLTQMRSSIGDLSAYGISTGATTGTGTFSADAVAGKLQIDDTKLTAALTAGGDGLKTALQGLGTRVAGVVAPVAGDRVTSALDSVAALRKDLADQMADADRRLADHETALRAKFTAMETALSAAQSQQSQLTAQLASL